MLMGGYAPTFGSNGAAFIVFPLEFRVISVKYISSSLEFTNDFVYLARLWL